MQPLTSVNHIPHGAKDVLCAYWWQLLYSSQDIRQAGSVAQWILSGKVEMNSNPHLGSFSGSYSYL